jgi:hypothetical protein
VGCIHARCAPPYSGLDAPLQNVIAKPKLGARHPRRNFKVAWDYIFQETRSRRFGVENMRRSMMFNATISNTYPYLMAVSTIVVLPILMMFFFGQKTFIEGISMTGIKE